MRSVLVVEADEAVEGALELREAGEVAAAELRTSGLFPDLGALHPREWTERAFISSYPRLRCAIMSRKEVTMDDLEPARKSKRERFLEVAPRRTSKVLRDLRVLGNCGNRSAYEYSALEVEKIFPAIQREMDLARSRFSTEGKRRTDFTLV
jgi:hypothetical protein